MVGAVENETSRPVLTFLVRITREAGGRVGGTVERVRTGEKERFSGIRGIGSAIVRMLERDESDTAARSRLEETP
ncbi:MAG TPA: hypothetical protein VJU81_04630 [Methylomirabilota bacterium]|nr:hypothetical protein [Methylomirabilota bacterium]